jgi:predicted Holliday junction resolvase-like endonuclease
MATPIAILFNIILFIILFILAIICVKIWVQIYSIKKQKEFRKYSLEQLTEKEEGSEQDLVRNESKIDQPNHL